MATATCPAAAIPITTAPIAISTASGIVWDWRANATSRETIASSSAAIRDMARAYPAQQIRPMR